MNRHQLKLFHGNRLERLAAALARELATPLQSPLAEEVIVVQSKGMERWVSLQLAEHWGICCNCRFPFPNALLEDLYRAAIDRIPERSLFDPEMMVWRIMQCLPSVLPHDEFSVLRKYLGDAVPGSLRWAQLCHRIARTFDHYLVYRLDTLEKWEQGEDHHWQALLWRELVSTTRDHHPGRLARRFMAQMETGNLRLEALPERISVFGISYLPPLYLAVLSAISRRIPVNLFVLNPCREYWFDIMSDKEMDRYRERLQARSDTGAAAAPDHLHLELGNPLLASMGAQGRHFLSQSYDRASDPQESFVEPGEDTLLSCLQSDILNLRERADRGPMPAGESPESPSISIHCCHSPMREVEILQDQLLDLFERDPTLRPSDVLVMTPDIDTYAPYFQAVFDTVENESTRIPYSLSDRSLRKENPYAEVLLHVLELAGGRFPASRVLDLLAKPVVRSAFGIDQEDLERITDWVRETRIRWAMDEAHRDSLNLPRTGQNTWQAGLDRLLLGYAMVPAGPVRVEGILPHSGVEGAESTVLGNFVEFVQTLYRQILDLQDPAPLKTWSTRLFHLLDRFMGPADEADEAALDWLRKVLYELGEWQDRSGFAGQVERPVIQWLLGGRFDRAGLRFGFLSGGVTVCAMLPMRSIPFRVICLLGMGYEGFPRRPVPLSFDLMALRPRPGDPSPGADDRYLFLETILSARDRLHISYVGQSIQDNRAVPPSVLVSELLDVLERGFFPSREQLLERLVTRHRLQSFSPAYFEAGSGLFSYSAANCAAAERLRRGLRQVPLFFPEPLADPADEWRTLSVDGFCRFFDSPARILLLKRLKLELADSVPIPEDLEPFELSGLDRYWIADTLLRERLQGKSIEPWRAAIRKEGGLPHGVAGELAFNRLAAEVTRFAAKISPRIQSEPLASLAVELNVGDFFLTGTLDSLYRDHLVLLRFGRLRAKDRLRLWIRHLVLSAVGGQPYPREALGIGAGKNGTPELFGFTPVDAPLPILERLLRLYWRGLHQPLKFFPETSYAYAQTRLIRGKDEAAAVKAAAAKWRGYRNRNGQQVPGEVDRDAYLDFCFGGSEPFDSDFRETACAVFEPLLAHQQEVDDA